VCGIWGNGDDKRVDGWIDGWEGGNVVFLIPVCWISGLELVLGILFVVWMFGCTVYRTGFISN
jgi:hypothetical protein